jgi:hypothetical protein
MHMCVCISADRSLVIEKERMFFICAASTKQVLTKLIPWNYCVSPSDTDFDANVVSHCDHDIKKIKTSLLLEVVCSDTC